MQIKTLLFSLDDNNDNITDISNFNKLTKSIIDGDKILRSGLSLSERKAAIKVVSSTLEKIKSLRNSTDDELLADELVNDYMKNLEKNPLYTDFTPVLHIEDSTFFYIFILLSDFIYFFIFYIFYINFYFIKNNLYINLLCFFFFVKTVF